MSVLCLLACLALASAAPRFEMDFDTDFGTRRSAGFRGQASFFNEDIFDTRRFWQELETEMEKLDQMMSDFYKHFPTTSSQSGVQGNEYIVTLSLNGFDEKDIKVKAKEGVLMIQAVHRSDEGSQSSYLDLKTLPSNVNVNGTWTFEAGVLKIVFPLKSTQAETPAVTEAATQSSVDDRSREEMDNANGGNTHVDADVGVENVDRDTEVLTNVIRQDPVEATTYAVDLKNEVEFVPVRY